MTRSAWLTTALVTTILAAAAGCSLTGATFPTIVDTTVIPWPTDNSGKRFTATTTNTGTTRVMLQFSRHEWQPYAHEHVIPENPNDRTHFVFQPPNPETFVQGERSFFRWLVLGGGPNDLDTIYAETPDREFRIGCAPGQDVEDLKADQRGVLQRIGSLDRLNNPAHVAELATKGYVVRTHGFASTKEMGVAFARTEALKSSIGEPLGAPVLGWPLLLFYEAGGGDTLNNTPDFPYVLIGWAHAANFKPSTRPTLGCIPSEAWFIHEAGWHEARGSFTATPPQESVSGTATMTSPPQRNFPPPWHPRFWDIHMWLDGDQGIPALRIIHPNRAIPGWSPDGTGFFAPPLIR